MIDWFSAFIVLAQDKPKAPTGFPVMQLVVPFVAIFFLWHLLIGRPQKRERRQRDDMLKQLKKNDRVVTIGGIIGTVSNVSADGDEVTLRVDDNARIRFRRSSIQSVVGDEANSESAKKL